MLYSNCELDSLISAETMTKIFISHWKDDTEFALQLAQALTRVGIDVWIDRSETRSDEDWNSAIVSGLRSCEAMIVISTDFLAEYFVGYQWRYFQRCGKKIFAALRTPKDELPEPLVSFAATDFHSVEFVIAFDQLCAELNRNGLTPDTIQGQLHEIRWDMEKFVQSSPFGYMGRFTSRARRICAMAEEEAERRRFATIGSEHFLLAFIRDEHGFTGRVMRELGVDYGRVSSIVDQIDMVPRSDASPKPLSPGGKRVIALAFEEARSAGTFFVSTPHLLIAVFDLTKSTADDILKQMNMGREAVILRAQAHCENLTKRKRRI